MLFPTTLVGSYPQPDWLIDRERLAGRFPPRVRARELWRVAEAHLAEAQDDATLVAINRARAKTRSAIVAVERAAAEPQIVSWPIPNLRSWSRHGAVRDRPGGRFPHRQDLSSY